MQQHLTIVQQCTYTIARVIEIQKYKYSNFLQKHGYRCFSSWDSSSGLGTDWEGDNNPAHLPAPMIVNISGILEFRKKYIFLNILEKETLFRKLILHLPAPMIVNTLGKVFSKVNTF